MARMGQTTSAPTETGTLGADRAVVRRLVLGSALMLFLELALIRWLGSNIVHLSYFSNFVLLGSFLGIGIGFLVSRRSWTLVPVAPLLLALLLVGVTLFPVSLNRTGSDVIYFTSLQATGPPAWLVLPVVFVVVALVIAGPAEIVGRCFADLTPLTAYRWDLVGSLIGIGGFTVLSFLWAPPVVWGAIVAVAFVLLGPQPASPGRAALGRGGGRRSCSSSRSPRAPAGRRTTRSRPRTSRETGRSCGSRSTGSRTR